MVALINRKGLLVLDSASGAGGAAINDNFIELADRWGGAVLKAQNGTNTAFPASADTDIARGDSLVAALAAAVAGQTIVVSVPGTYKLTNTQLFKNEVDWWFGVGILVILDDTAAALLLSLFDDSSNGANEAIICNIGGFGDLQRKSSVTLGSEGQESVIRVTNDSSIVNVQVYRLYNISTDSGSGELPAIHLAGGKLSVIANSIRSVKPLTILYFSGDLRLKCNELLVDDTSSNLTAFQSSAGQPLATYTSGTVNIDVNKITGSIATAGTPDAKIFINAEEIIGVSTADNVLDIGGNDVYITTNKILGKILLRSQGSFGARLHLYTQLLVTEIATAPAIDIQAGTISSNMWIGEITDTGNNATDLIKCISGIHRISGINWVGGTGAFGVTIDVGSGRLDISNVRIDTSAASTKNPAFVAAAGLSLQNCRLISNDPMESIIAIAAQTVKIYGVFANVIANAFVTEAIEAITVDALVD